MHLPLLLLICSAPPVSPSVRLTDDAVLSLASVEQARAAQARSDLFVNSLGDLERQIRLASSKPVSVEQFIEHAQQQMLPWEEKQQERLLTIAASLAEKLAGLELPLPREVLLMQTTGRDESGAAYTRGNAIFFPRGRLNGKDAALERLLAHELFHVMSRHDADLRRKLYAIIGFQPCSPFELPAQLDARRITNPDAPAMDYYIAVEHQEEVFNVVPILLSDRAQYDPRRKGLFDYLQFRLLAVHRQGGKWQPLLSGGEPILLDGRANNTYREKIGENTNYIIHPDEILAVNFEHLVMKTKNLKTPEIVEKMRKILRQ